ncbi:hypothetical protein QBC40DRAFT_224444 [Triangularia verruculosa]|uniref:NAD(P)-binding protein n=1 Tax=Triangularia verruculosa TaxID=2587418 RepID=A0AAN7AWI6_9PEZI|nr:hypothetical protein QBC40DRAFT_224444 [Triangularia verruculosa]
MADHSKNIVYLVTGANRGIGLAVIYLLAARPNTTVLATARSLPTDDDNNQSSVFSSIVCHESSSLIPILLDETKPAISSSTLPARLSSAGIEHINIVIANAGTATNGFKSVFDTTEEDYRNDFEVNTLGPIRLFKGIHGLLEKGAEVSGQESKFVVVGSSVGSTGGLVTAEGEMEGGMLVCGSYGLSKAGVQWWVMKLRAELKGKGGEGKVVVGVVHPGWVKTEMGQGLADAVGFRAGPPLGVEESATGVVEQVDKLTMENSGQFWRWDGGVLPW